MQGRVTAARNDARLTASVGLSGCSSDVTIPVQTVSMIGCGLRFKKNFKIKKYFDKSVVIK